MKFLSLILVVISLQASARVFDKVEVYGRFKGWENYRNWVVFIENLPDSSRKFQSNKAKVDREGNFLLKLEGVPEGDYMFQFGDDTVKGYGGGPIKIDGYTINLGVKTKN